MSTLVVNADPCGKVVYVSRSEALAASKRMRGATTQQRPYRCPEGHWHLTSRPRQAKKHLPEGSKDPDAVRQARARRAARRATQRRAEKKQLATVTPIKVTPKPKPSQSFTGCPECGYRWKFGDQYLNPEGRHCPTPTCKGHIVLGLDARGREFRFELGVAA